MEQAAVTAGPDIWPILLPVIIGGLLATLPAMLGQILTHALADSAAKKSRRRERFQLIASGLADHAAWLDKRRSNLAFDGPAVEHSDPLPGIITVAMMDFPELLPALDLLETNARTYSMWQIQAASKRLKGDIAGLNDGIEAAFRPFWDQHLQVQKKLRAIADTQKFS